MFDQPTVMTVQQRFTNSFFEIPRYQRPYTWTQDDVSQLIEDIDASENGYFIGSTIYYKSDNADDTYEIIDGQQRLTTISLIISVLAEIYKSPKIDKEDFANIVLQKLIEGEIWRDSNNLVSKIRLYKKSSDPITQEFFAQEIVKVRQSTTRNFRQRDLNAEAKKLQKNRKFILDTIKQKIGLDDPERTVRDITEDLEDFKNKLLEARILTIAATDFNEAYTIFKTLNSTGQDLSLNDLIKSSLLQHIPENAGHDSPNTKWNEISGYLESARSVTPRLNIEDFFYYSWVTRGKEVSKKSSFYTELDRSLNSETAPEVMQNLLEDAEIYEIIFSGRERYTGKKNNLNKAIKNLRRFGVTQYAPFLLVLFRSYLKNTNGIDLAIIKKTINNLEKFHFQYNAVTKSPGNRISKIYPRAAQNIMEARNSDQANEVINNLTNELIPLQPSLSKFVEEFENITYFNEKNISENNRRLNDIARYALEKIYQINEYSTFGKNTSELTVEHIIPQSLGTRRRNNRNRYIGTLGNLIFLTQEVNNEIGDIDLTQKREYFKENGVTVPEYVANDEFTRESVNSRTEHFAKQGYLEVWLLKTEDSVSDN